jgi:hypothetical protein
MYKSAGFIFIYSFAINRSREYLGLSGIVCRKGGGNMKNELASMIDHTLLKPETAPGAIERLCEEAVQYHFASVCVQPSYVTLAVPLRYVRLLDFPWE